MFGDRMVTMRLSSLFLIYIMVVNWSVYGSSVVREFAYGCAISNAKSGNLTQARDQLGALLANADQDPDLLYDLGVVSYRSQEYEQAQAYFETASRYTQDSKLREKALFNLGNVQVSLKDYARAIQTYDQLLKDNADNAYAKHNRDKAEQLLKEQQEKQEQGEEEKDKNKDNNSQSKDQSAQESPNNTNEDDSSHGDKNQERNEHKQNRDQQGKNSQSHSSDQKSEKKESNDNEAGASNSEKSEHNDNKKQQQLDQSSEKKEKEENEGSSERQSQQKDQGARAQKDDHGFEGGGNKEQSKTSFGENEQWMAHLLEQQEQSDAKMHRVLLKGAINTATHGGNDEIHNW